MKWLLNQTLRVKLIIAFTVASALLSLTAWQGMKGINRLYADGERQLKENSGPSMEVGLALSAFEEARATMLEMTFSSEKAADTLELSGRLKADLARLDEFPDIYSKGQPDADEQRAIESLREGGRQFGQTAAALSRTMEDATLGPEAKKEQALKYLQNPSFMQAVDSMRAGLKKLAQAREKRIAQASADFQEARRWSKLVLWIWILISLVIIMGVGSFVAHLISFRFGEIISAIRQMATGDLSTPKLHEWRTDEIGELSRTVLSTIEAQRKLLGEIMQASTLVSTSADEISASAIQITKGAENQSTATDETSSSIIEMASQIEHVAKSAQALAVSVDETSSSIQEMATSIEHVAKNSDNLLASVEETSSTIEEMTASIRSVADRVKVVDEVSRLAAKAAAEGGTDMARVIGGIGNSSKDISKIVKIIEEIANRTNLLSLNAAIEAARAGEAGKGFAVVAEEVKRLAERSMSSTREITTFVDAVQSNVDQAVELSQSVLKQMTDSVAKTSQLVSEVYLAAQEQNSGASQILKTSTNMQLITRELTTAAKEQAQGAKEIMKAVVEMNRMTQHVADATLEQKKGGDIAVKATEQIAQVAQQNLAATEELSRATASLSKEAEHMQALAHKFTF